MWQQLQEKLGFKDFLKSGKGVATPAKNVEAVQKKPKAKPVELTKVKKQYAKHPSFSELLPIAEWNESERVFLLEDGYSMGCMFEIKDVATEARLQSEIDELHQKIAEVLSHVVPLEGDNPWVMQIFVQDDPSLASLSKRLHDYVPKSLRDDSFTQKYLNVVDDHLKKLSHPEGMFEDPLSGLPFRGKTRRIRVAIYRRYSNKKKIGDLAPLEELNSVAANFITNMQTIGVKIRRMGGKQIYDWLVRWFNPKPAMTDGNVDALLNDFPYPEDDEKPYGWSFPERIFFNEPSSYKSGWLFDDLKHKVMVFRGLHRTVDIGVISRERNFGDNKYALMDKFPDGTIYTIQVVFESREQIEEHLLKVEKSAVGKGDEPKRVRRDVNDAFDQMKNGNMLFKVTHAIYYRGEDDGELTSIERELIAILRNSGLAVIDPRYELNPIDNYLRFLPFQFNPTFDKKYLFRSTYQYATDVASLLPIYGRSRGDGRFPLHIFYNRGGEAFIFDNFNPNFKMSNSHMVIVGSTGAGKSVSLNNFIFALLAMKNARVYVVEAGGSFDLLSDYIAGHDKSVRRLKFDRLKPVAVNPFAEAYRALDQILAEEQAFAENNQAHADGFPEQEVLAKHSQKIANEVKQAGEIAKESDLACDENRDILSEMALAIRTMITGGLPKEEEKFSLSDDMLVIETLIEAIKSCKAKNIPQVLTQHVIEQFEARAKTATVPEVAKRLDEMGRSMMTYIKNPMKARFFNRASEPFEDTDFMQVELGFLQESQNASMLSLVAISLLAKILAIAEKNQHSDRPTVLILDEAHILFKNPLVATFVILMAKVARKIGLWIVPCTQNIEDFSGVESKKVLSMMETWLCLAIDKTEIKNITKFKPLTDEQISLIQDIKKFPKVYSEGVLLGARYQGLFRNVPPRLSLSLAMTEQVEKAERRQVMEEHQVDELRAAELIAKKLEKYRAKVSEDEVFDD